MKKLYGVTVAMVTPMFEDGRIDLAGVAKLTEMLVGKGVQCLYPCGNCIALRTILNIHCNIVHKPLLHQINQLVRKASIGV